MDDFFPDISGEELSDLTKSTRKEAVPIGIDSESDSHRYGGELLPEFVQSLMSPDAVWGSVEIPSTGCRLVLPESALKLGADLLREFKTRMSGRVGSQKLFSISDQRATFREIADWAFGSQEESSAIFTQAQREKIELWFEELYGMYERKWGYQWSEAYASTLFGVGVSRITRSVIDGAQIDSKVSSQQLEEREKDASLQELFRHGLTLKTGFMNLESLDDFPISMGKFSQLNELYGTIRSDVELRQQDWDWLHSLGFNLNLHIPQEVNEKEWRLCLTVGREDSYRKADERGHVYFDHSHGDALILIYRQLQLSNVLDEVSGFNVWEEWDSITGYSATPGVEFSELTFHRGKPIQLPEPPQTFYFIPKEEERITRSYRSILDFVHRLDSAGFTIADERAVFSFEGVFADEIEETASKIDLDGSRINGFSAGWFFEWEMVDGQPELLRVEE